MDRATHAWIALRAIALLEESGGDKNLVALLKPRAASATIGAWLPDLTDAKRGGGQTQHHVLKMLPMPGGANSKSRFVSRKKELLGRMSFSPAARAYLEADVKLTSEWWSRPYKADPRPGQHIANRAMGIATSLRDLLVIGDKKLDALVPGSVSFLKDVPPGALTRPDQAALYFFMLSHFIADASMPCHCDGRPACGYDSGLHMEMEKHWSKQLGKVFAGDDLFSMEHSLERMLVFARQVDAHLEADIDDLRPGSLPSGRDVWLETIDAARASFSLMALILPESSHPYSGGPKRAEFKHVFSGPGGEALLAEVSRICLTDAVFNTAAAWVDIWEKVGKA